MSAPSAPPDRSLLEELWQQRLKDARLRLAFSRQYLKEVRRDFPSSGRIHGADGAFAYKHALDAEVSAMANYRRVLRIFTDLVMHGKIPEPDVF